MSKNSYLVKFCEINFCQAMALYCHEMIKIGNQTKENSQVLSLVLECFCCRLHLSDMIALMPICIVLVFLPWLPPHCVTKEIKSMNKYDLCTYGVLHGDTDSSR